MASADVLELLSIEPGVSQLGFLRIVGRGIALFAEHFQQLHGKISTLRLFGQRLSQQIDSLCKSTIGQIDRHFLEHIADRQFITVGGNR
ncbi:hypothetical protein D3C86_1718240 [compost metagenome]